MGKKSVSIFASLSAINEVSPSGFITAEELAQFGTVKQGRVECLPIASLN